MIAPRRIRYPDLPVPLRERFTAADLLYAHVIDGSAPRYVVHVLDRAAGKSVELECEADGRSWLTAEERLARLPVSEEVEFPDLAAIARTSYAFDPATQEVRMRLVVTDLSHGGEAGSDEGALYVPVPDAPKRLAERILARHRLPLDYAAWAEAQKIEHFAVVLHRIRRECGEQGHDEDEVYTPQLMGQFEQTDPQVATRMRAILAEAGALEQTSAAEMIAGFQARLPDYPI